MSGDRLSGILGLLVSIYIVIMGFKYHVGVKGVLGTGQLGPGFFPVICGICLGCCSTMLLVQSFLQTPEEKPDEAQGKKGNTHLLVYSLVALIIYALVFEWLGFILSTFFLVIFLLKLLERKKKWLEVLLTAGVSSVGIFAIFKFLLKSSLPNGLLDVFLR